MVTYNVTLVVAPDLEHEALKYVREQMLPRLVNAESAAMNPELKKVVETGGEKPGEDHGLSLALSVDFSTEVEAHEWHDRRLMPVLGDFHGYFGENALFFVTMLEKMAI